MANIKNLKKVIKQLNSLIKESEHIESTDNSIKVMARIVDASGKGSGEKWVTFKMVPNPNEDLESQVISYAEEEYYNQGGTHDDIMVDDYEIL